MPRPIVDSAECSGCGICIDSCPNSVLDLNDDIAVASNEDECDGCATCQEDCPMSCIEIEED